MLDQVLSSTARYLFAYNQTPARLVLDPLYAMVARALLHGEVPLSPRLLAREYEDDLYVGYRERSRKLAYFIEDWEFTGRCSRPSGWIRRPTRARRRRAPPFLRRNRR